jgi:hypothetical protein
MCQSHNLYVHNHILDIDPQLSYKTTVDCSLYNWSVSLSLSLSPSKKLAVIPPSAPIKLYCHVFLCDNYAKQCFTFCLKL